MAALTIRSDFGAQENEICYCFHFFLIYLLWSDGTRCHDLSFLNVEFYASPFTLLFYPQSRGSLAMVSSAYLRLLIFLPAILNPACVFSSSTAFLMIYSAYKLNEWGDNIQPWHTPLPILYQFFVPCPVLTVPSWPAYRFLRSQVRWSGIPISWRIVHSLLWSTQSRALV